MDILILGKGCVNCTTLEKRVHQALNELRLDAEVYKISDFAKISEYGVMSTPAMVVDEKVIFYGRVPAIDELKKILINLEEK